MINGRTTVLAHWWMVDGRCLKQFWSYPWVPCSVENIWSKSWWFQSHESHYFKCPPEISLHVPKLLSKIVQELSFTIYGNLGQKILLKYKILLIIGVL